MGDMGFTAPSTASRKNLLSENLAHSVLTPAPGKPGMFSKAKVPSTSATGAFKAKGICQAWELTAWG